MPVISKVKLPSGSYYDIKDSAAWVEIGNMKDGNQAGSLQNQIDTLSEQIAGGVSFNIVWTLFDYSSSTQPSAAKLATIPSGVEVYYNNGAAHKTGTLTASADTKGTFYLIYSKTHAGTLDAFDEYATIQSNSNYYWEKIGDTQIDLSGIVTDVSVSSIAPDNVLGADTTFTNSSSTVTFSGGTTDKVLGEATTFGLTNGTVSFGAITSHTASVLGENVTYSVTDPTITVTPSTTYVKATATGTAVGANGTAAAVTGYSSVTSDTFVKSVSAETNKKLVTTSITPTNGTETVSKVTKSTSKLVTTSIPNVTGNTDVSIPNITNVGTASTWSFTMGSGADSETLIIGGANSTTPTLGASLAASKVTLGTNITAATGAVAATGSGADVITGVSISDKTVAKAGTAVTVATGATASDGAGDSIVTGVTIGDTASAITSLGNPTTSTVLTGVKVTTQPIITLATDTSSGTGKVQVATGISSASATGTSVTHNSGNYVDAIVSMPTASVGTAITVGTNDKVTTVTSIGTGTAAAQTITVGTNDIVAAATSVTLNVTKGG